MTLLKSMPRVVAFTLLAVVMLAKPARATWSILIVDTATGEVAIGIATCLTSFDLRPSTVVVVPGVGVAAAQSFVGPLRLREVIRAELLNGTPPAQILAALAATDPGHQSRQYGIADTQGGAMTFTGTGAGSFASGLNGRVGSLVYTCQGNVLTGLPVLSAAEQAIVSTPGDVGQKLMAAMEAARAMGGDGRCSCSSFNPTGCGAPPPNFSKSSHIGLVIVSRPGDLDVSCNPSAGCGAGSYYLDLNVANQPASAQDPVFQLQNLYNTWRAAQSGRPDHFQSSVSMSRTQLRANGVDTATGTVVLNDLVGSAVGTTPNVTVSVNPLSSANGVQIGPVVPLSNGSYTFSLTAGADPGDLILDVVADDGRGAPVLISPQPILQVEDPFGPCGIGSVNHPLGGFADSLRINGSPGASRVVEIDYGQPFAIDLDAPPQSVGGLTGNFLLWLHLGLPNPMDSFFVDPTAGSMCFTPAPFSPTAPTILLADSLGLGGLFRALPAPWTGGVPGIPAVLDLTLQGVVVENLQAELAVTNALLLRVKALPAPAITMVAPIAAGPGASVAIAGSGFRPGATIDVGGVRVVPNTVTGTSVTFTMPAGVGCDAPLTLTNIDGQQASSMMNPTPVITNTLFNTGSSLGNSLFIIQGRGLDGVTVTIGGAPATITSSTSVSLVVSTPPGAVGSAQVVVSSPAGCSASTTYTYR